MSFREYPAKILREIKRPFKRLEQKLRHAAQRFVIKTVEKNASCLQARISASTGPVNASSPTTSPQMDALLLAFLRSQMRRNTYGLAIDASSNSHVFSQNQSFTLQDASWLQESTAVREKIEQALCSPVQSCVTLHVNDADIFQSVGAAVAKLCPPTHSMSIYRPTDIPTAVAQTASSGCVVVFKRKVA